MHMHKSYTTFPEFNDMEMLTIAEIQLDEKALECELLKINLRTIQKESEMWKNLYDNAINFILSRK